MIIPRADPRAILVTNQLIRKRTIIPMTRTSSILPNFLAMYKKLTKMLKIIEEIMKIQLLLELK